MDATIGRYRVQRRIGAGSFASVWLGHDDELDVPVAIKVLAENWSDNADVRARFLAEARIMRRLHDPRLVQVYDIGTLPDGRPYFVMDHIDGGSLNDLRKSGVPPVRALQLSAQACRALDVLHENDLIHRDVTPANLLLRTGPRDQLRVLIADLGVAKSTVEAVGATMTAGTPSYMAPEQASGATLDRRADIFSLTAVTYALLTGSPPFPVQTVGDILARDHRQPPAPLAERLGAPAALDAVLASGLAWEPAARPPRATLLADALDRLATQLAEAPERTPTSMARPAETPVSRTPEPVAPVGPVGPVAHVAPVTPAPAPSPTPPALPGRPAAPGSSAEVAPHPSAPEPPRSRSPWTYVLFALGALALFTVSMLVTIWVLR